MERLFEKIKVRLMDLFEEDYEEEGKVEIIEDERDMKKDPSPGQKLSLMSRVLFIPDLALSVLLAIPLFCAIPIAGSLLYHTENKLYIEHLIFLGLISIVIFIFLRVFRKYMYVGLSVLLIAFTLNQKDHSSFESLKDNIVQDYRNASAKIIQANLSWRSIETVKRKNRNPKYFKAILRSDISPKTRNFAVSASTEYFGGPDLYDQYGDVIRYISLYQYLTANFSYVHDPLYHNYYSMAEETIDNGLAGDCDDWSGLIYTSIKAIGGQARLISISGHMYPEVMVGKTNDFELNLIPLLDSLFKREYLTDYYHHIDKFDRVWLSFDFGEYPGEYYHYSDIEEIIY